MVNRIESVKTKSQMMSLMHKLFPKTVTLNLLNYIKEYLKSSD